LGGVYSTVDLHSPDLKNKLREWQNYYNYERSHSALKNQTPWEKCRELASKTPVHDEVEALFDDTKESFKEQNYRANLELQKVKVHC
jgi:hypothetical protein